MVLERALDALMKEVGGQELVNVGVWEVVGKRLAYVSEGATQKEAQPTYLAIRDHTIIVPQRLRIERVEKGVCVAVLATRRHAVQIIWMSCTAGAPSLYDTRQEDLLRVIGDVGPDPIDSLAVVSIAITHDLRCLHAWPESKEDEPQRRMEELPSE